MGEKKTNTQDTAIRAVGTSVSAYDRPFLLNIRPLLNIHSAQSHKLACYTSYRMGD